MSNYIKVLEQVKKMSIDDQWNLLQELKYCLNEYKVENDQEWNDWDQQIEKDCEEGKLDFLIEEALTAKAENKLRNL